MEDERMLTDRVILGPGRAREAMRAFLRENGLGLEADVEYSYCVMDGARFAAAGSLAGPVIKCVAVDPEYRALGLSARVVSALCREAAERGRDRLFVFTKPGNLPLFQGLGFYPVVSSERAALMENQKDALQTYLTRLAALRRPGSAGAVVLNANPFTLGHLYLVRTAAAEVDHLHIFVVGEDKSDFSSAVREELVRRGTADIPNATVHAGTPYVISAATFPSYFLKDTGAAAEAHAQLDLTLFGRRIAPALGIARRFVGEEPLSPSTDLYNQVMLRVLPPLGVAVRVVPRLQSGGAPISASRVRALWRAGRLEAARPLLPPATYEYLAAHPAVNS